MFVNNRPTDLAGGAFTEFLISSFLGDCVHVEIVQSNLKPTATAPKRTHTHTKKNYPNACLSKMLISFLPLTFKESSFWACICCFVSNWFSPNFCVHQGTLLTPPNTPGLWLLPFIWKLCVESQLWVSVPADHMIKLKQAVIQNCITASDGNTKVPWIIDRVIATVLLMNLISPLLGF